MIEAFVRKWALKKKLIAHEERATKLLEEALSEWLKSRITEPK